MAKRRGLVANGDTEDLPPRPDAMMESIRAVGYTLPAAVADLVDNSVSAGASRVDIDFHWDGSSSAIVVADDGRGMDEDRLREAMRLGTQSPLEERDAADLGRFGLGLKTASFSQARQLTVVSRTQGLGINARHWDLDLLGHDERWPLQRGVPAEAAQYVDALDKQKHGTIVVWRKLDRLLSARPGLDDDDRDLFLRQAVRVRDHVAMVFHRFLEVPNPLQIFVNNKKVELWDPFLRGHEKTQWLQEEAHAVFGDRIHVHPFVLPHHSHLSPEEHERAGGIKGWNAQQGFYVYRNKRLLVAGDYLGLDFRQEPHYSLARIMVDIPNTMDAEWQIDVKKATATPPPGLRKDLTRIARLVRKRAGDVYRHRGKVIRRQHAKEEATVWQLKKKSQKKFYAVNRSHPVIGRALASSPEVRAAVTNVIAIIERSLPLEAMIYQVQEAPDEFWSGGERADDAAVIDQGVALFKLFMDEGMEATKARTRLLAIEPFCDSAALVARLDELAKERDK